ncbi:hypothetical protein JOM56_009630 [Amanita muscaria]
MISLALPHELMERILLLLDTKSMLKCRLVNREFNAIIQSSTLVQYYLACKAAGVIDNPQSPLSYAERLEALKKREDAWRKLKPMFETTMDIDEGAEGGYELTAGYFCRGQNYKDLYCCHLPSSPEDNLQWFRIPTHGPGQSWSGFMHVFGTAVYEHDLVVNVISSEVGNQADMQRHSLDLVLLKFSTGEHHPLARHPLIHVQRSPSDRPFASVRIVGDHLALLVDDQDGSKLFIFDWKTGHKRLQHKATENAYKSSTPVFISSELLLVPDCNLSRFEVWHILPNPNSPIQILSLQIPAVSAYYYITYSFCHGELSPFLHSMPYYPPRPFFPSSENSIITVNLLFSHAIPGFLQFAYKLVIHRRALLDMVQKWTSPSLPEQEDWGPTISRWFPLNTTYHMRIPQSNGQRCVFLDPNPHDKRRCTVSVADFNLYNVKRNAEMMGQLGGREGEGNDDEDEELEILLEEGLFAEEVSMGLKCVVYRAPGEYEFDAVMMDEERLLGFKYDKENRTENIKVLYIG